MKLAIASTLGFTAFFLSSAASASNSFGGSSLFYLHALSAEDQETYIKTLSGYGAKVLRLWGMFPQRFEKPMSFKLGFRFPQPAALRIMDSSLSIRPE